VHSPRRRGGRAAGTAEFTSARNSAEAGDRENRIHGETLPVGREPPQQYASDGGSAQSAMRVEERRRVARIRRFGRHAAPRGPHTGVSTNSPNRRAATSYATPYAGTATSPSSADEASSGLLGTTRTV
jgi:hypothetical protein